MSLTWGPLHLVVLAPLRNYVIGFFKRSPDNNEGLSNIEKTTSKATPRKSGDITTMEKTRSLPFNEARKIAKEKSDADLNLFKAEVGARIEASLLIEAKKLLVSGKVHTFKDAKNLAKELSEAELEIFKNETFKRIEIELLKSAKKIIDKGEATSLEGAKKIAKQRSDAELEVFKAECNARLEKDLLEETKKYIANTQ